MLKQYQTNLLSPTNHRGLCSLNGRLGKPESFFARFRGLGLRNGHSFTMMKLRMQRFVIPVQQL